MNFLIVDDEVDLDTMKRTLETEYPGSVVHTARSTGELRDRLTLAEKRGFVYGVVVLDFKLPPTVGGDPVVDLESRQLVQQSPATAGATVFHMTAYQEDAAIQEWVRAQRDLNPSMAEPFPIIKKGVWTEKLYEAIRRVVYETRVSVRLARLFEGDHAESPAVARLRAAALPSASRGQELSALIRDIELHWRYLSAGLRNRVCQIFPVTPDPDGPDKVRIHLS